MKTVKTVKKWLIFFLVGMLLTGSVSCYTYADEAAEEAGGEEGEAAGGEEGEEGEENPEEGEEGEEGEMSAEEAQAALERVTPSSISTNIDGKYLALTFPASEVPEGFAVKTVDYQGEQVMLAYITSKSSTIGAEGLTVYLAYLTDKDGNNGEFYLCDTTENAKMSDMIKIDGAPGRFIIVLDPGDNVVGPDGFTKHKLQWGNKTATAWSLPEETVEEEEEEKEKSTEEKKDDESASLFFTKVYAAELNLNAGEAKRDGDSSPLSKSEEPEGDVPADTGDKAEEEEMDDNAMLALDAIAHTNASGLIQAQPKEFCLLYAVDESANLGFFLYDIERGTYQRYVDIPKGESKTLMKYKKLSRTRLFIIIILAILLVVAGFILINTLVNKKEGDYDEDEEDPEEEAMRKRAKDKERKNIGKRERAYLLDEEPEEEEEFEDDYEEGEEESDEEEEDYEEEDEEEEEEEEVRPVKHRSITRKNNVVRSERKKQSTRDEVDWANMEITAGLNPKKTNEAMERKKDMDLDEDFDFEFLNVKK